MTALLDVILPVFLVIGFGYGAARFGLFSEASVDGLMRFAQNFALPCLLFRSIATLDLAGAYDAGLMVSFYAGAFSGFTLCFAGALWLFNRPLTDSVAIGFAGLFSNSLLLGLPITERAYGAEALQGNFAIISIHSPLLYGFGIALMEWARTRGQGLSGGALVAQIGRAVGKQPLVIGIALGFAVNLSGAPLPGAVMGGVDLMARAAIPAALFGLGGVLFRYRPEGDKATVALICGAALIVHPAVTWLLGTRVFDLDTAALRSGVVTGAMAPGVNAYLFSNMYGVAKRVTATAVLAATALSILSVWMWLAILP